MNFEYKLIEKIESMNVNKMSAREVSTKFGMTKKFEMQEVERVLNKMVDEGKLVKSYDGKFTRKSANNSGIKGVLRGNKRGFAFLIREDGGEDLFIPAKSLNGAMHGDTVIAKIVRGDEAQVSTIVERGISRLVGVFKRYGEFGFCIPDGNSYYKDIYISPKNTIGAEDNSKVVVEIIGYAESPEGKITEIIGNADEKQSGVLSILKSHNFFNFFPEKTELEAKFKQYQPVENRVSYVDLLTVTIDGEDSKDLDDAITLIKEKNGYKLYVHIADVSHYVEIGSSLDDEAFKRCTSVYFPGSVYPMLPKILSNGLCSLNQGEDRLSLTCVMTIDNQGIVTDVQVNKSIINNDCRMTYNQVTAIIEGNNAEVEKVKNVVPMIMDMFDLSRLLKNRRQERGNINFDTKESKIIIDAEGNVEKIEPYPYTVSNEIIEEFMLLANESVAKLIADKGLPFVYRVHEKPDPEKMKAFRDFAGALGYNLPQVEEITPKMLQELLTKIEGNPLEPVISKVMLRSMKKAKYDVQCSGHFGLAAEFYCHFTSPIRRYPDLQIHRIIKDMLDDKLGSIPKLAKWCKEVADTSSEREREAELAEREIDDFYKTEYMLRHVGEEFVGIVSGVTNFGIFVELENTCEGLARLDNLPKDNYNFVEERYRLQGAYHSYTLGQTVKIEVLDCDLETRKVSFAVIEEDVDGVRKPLGGESANKPADRNKGDKKFGDRKPYNKSNSKPSGERKFSDKPSGERKFSDKPSGEKKFSDKPSGERKFSDKPSGERKFSDKPSGERKFSDKPSGERKFSDKPSGERKFSDKPSGERKFSDKPSGEKKFSDKPSGERKFSDKSSGERKFSDKPSGERKFSDKSSGERKFSDKPSGERKFSDKSSGERKFSDIPSGDKNKSAKPYAKSSGYPKGKPSGQSKSSKGGGYPKGKSGASRTKSY